MSDYDLGTVREMLSKAFSNDEISNLTIDIFPDIYGDFSNSMGKGQKIRTIVEHGNGQGQLEKLLDYVKDKNPYQYNQYIEKIRDPNSVVKTPQPPVDEKSTVQPQPTPLAPAPDEPTQPANNNPSLSLLLITVVLALAVTAGVAWILDAILALSGNLAAFVVVLAIVFTFVLVVIGKVTGADYIKLLTESFKSSK